MPTDLERIIASHLMAATLASSLRPVEKEEALAYLGTLVEFGKEHWLATLRDENIQLPPGEPERIITDTLTIIEDKEILFTNPSFAFSLRLAICKIASDERDWKPMFLKRLVKIFPEELADRLWVYAVHSIICDGKAGKDVVPSREQINAHLERRRQIILSHAPEQPYIRTGNPMASRSLGTHTRLEKCPQCGLEKRCDAKTKRFRCKQCDLDQPYPFQPASP